MTSTRTIDDDKMMRHVRTHPFPLVFATISGAHLYGFPSPDSDFDLRGVHLLPLETVVGLDRHSLPSGVPRHFPSTNRLPTWPFPAVLTQQISILQNGFARFFRQPNGNANCVGFQMIDQGRVVTDHDHLAVLGCQR